LILIGVHQSSALLEYQTPLELYKNHELIVIGKVISLTEISKQETIYNIKVEEYLKNPKPYDLIDAYGLGTKNGGVWIEDQTVFEIGDRVLLYLYKENGKYKISPYSFIAPKSCEKHQLLDLPIIPGEPDRGFRPSSGPIYLASINENETVTIPSSAVNRLRNNIEIIIKYDAWNNHRTFMDFDVEISITRDNETAPVFHDKHTLYNLEPCSGPLTESWNFTPKETGKYTVTVFFDGITTSYDFAAREPGGSVTMDKTVYPVPFSSSPLKQFKSGVAAEDVICKEGLQLIIKSKDHTPACVRPSSISKLIAQGWGDYDPQLSEEQQLVITNLTTQDHSVQKLLSGKDWYIRAIQSGVSFGNDCPFGSCYSILIDQVDRNETLVAIVNLATKKVIDVRTTPGWNQTETEIQKMWVEIDPIQCAGNPWEQDWIKSYPDDYLVYARVISKEKIDIITSYYKKLGIMIFDAKLVPWDNMVVCESCSCPVGYTQSLLVSNSDVDKMLEFGYKTSENQ